MLNTKTAFAAKMYFETSMVADLIHVDVLFDSQKDNINVLEARIIYPESIKQEIKNISDGNSSINYWLQKPELSSDSSISLSGIIPGGINGNRLKIFSFDIPNNSNIKGQFIVEDAHAYINNGQGSSIKVDHTDLYLPVASVVNSSNETNLYINDNVPPEYFKPSFTQDDNLYNNRKILIFATQDKGSGINRYEVKEGYWDNFHIETSPYILKNQDSIHKISIKAVDNSGNIRLVEYYPPGYLLWYQHYIIIGIILLVIIFGTVACIRYIKKY